MLGPISALKCYVLINDFGLIFYTVKHIGQDQADFHGYFSSIIITFDRSGGFQSTKLMPRIYSRRALKQDELLCGMLQNRAVKRC